MVQRIFCGRLGYIFGGGGGIESRALEQQNMAPYYFLLLSPLPSNMRKMLENGTEDILWETRICFWGGGGIESRALEQQNITPYYFLVLSPLPSNMRKMLENGRGYFVGDQDIFFGVVVV